MKPIISFLFLITSYLAVGQVTNEGKPHSWAFKNQFQSIQAIRMPSFDIQKLLAEDKINDRTGEKPWRFGTYFTPHLSFL